jgi:glucose/arabinose dehydrogenase
MEASVTAIRLPLSLFVLLAVASVGFAQTSPTVLTGKAAFGDWHSDAPGTMRKITAADLPKPLDTPSTANRSRVVARPADAGLKVPDGFAVAPFATNLPGARVLRVAPNGDVFLAQSDAGKIVVMRAADGAAKPTQIETFAEGLRQPFGIAFYPPGPDPQFVYVGETNEVVRFPYKSGDMKASGKPEVIVPSLPPGGGHWTRDVAFSPDGATLYVAVGSGSNAAEDLPAKPELAAWQKEHGLGAVWGPREEWRANVLAFSPDGKNRRPYATGIRNCSGLAVEPRTGTVFCATNERDALGDNLPPDYVTSVKENGFYGWPWYYIGDNEDPRHRNARPDLKGHVIVPDVLLQPHSAPLGIAFNTGKLFPPEWEGDAFVALHGSWNRSLHTGYKIVRLPFQNGKPTGEYQDFVVGFTAGEQNVWGRPVDVAFAHDGAMLFSDDGNGVVYRVSYKAR